VNAIVCWYFKSLRNWNSIRLQHRRNLGLNESAGHSTKSVGAWSTGANPKPIDTEELVLSQESASEFFAIDQARVEIPTGPTLILGTQETRVRNPDERCLFRAPRVLIIIGIVSTARSLTSLGELNSLHGRRSQNLGRLQDARPRFSCQGPRKFSGDIAGESLRRTVR